MKFLKKYSLLSLALEADIFKTGEEYFYYPYPFLYSFLSAYQPSSVRSSLLQLTRANLVDKILRNNRAYFKLSSLGRDTLLHFFKYRPSFSKAWDGYWRVAFIKGQTISKKGDSTRFIRGILKENNFRKLKKGVYLAPFNDSIKSIRGEIIRKEHGFQQIYMFKSKNIHFIDTFHLIEKLYNLSTIAKGYNKLVIDCKRLLTGIGKKKLLTQQDKKAIFPILKKYFSLLEKDPFLPKTLISADFPQKKCQKMIKKLASMIKSMVV
jgi:DNA-binding transcriptional regulator PaaX